MTLHDWFQRDYQQNQRLLWKASPNREPGGSWTEQFSSRHAGDFLGQVYRLTKRTMIRNSAALSVVRLPPLFRDFDIRHDTRENHT